MPVYHDMACDAGYAYGTEENEQMAAMIYAQEEQANQEYLAEQEYIKFLEEVYWWLDWWHQLGQINY